MFRKFADAVHARYRAIAEGELFVVDVEDIFETYLASFPSGTNPVFRVRTVHDCACCKQFLRRIGVLVSLKPDGSRITLWDGLEKAHDLPHPYGAVASRLGDVIRQAPIASVFRTNERAYGTDHNYDGETNERYDHFHGEVLNRHHTHDAATKRGEAEATFQVLKRGLTELKQDDLGSVLELIDSNGLYRGGEHRESVVGFLQLMQRYTGGDDFVWANIHDRTARFRNTAIGTLLVDLAEGQDIERAVHAFEAKVAPQNYKRPTTVITQRMVNEAVKTLKNWV